MSGGRLKGSKNTSGHLYNPEKHTKKYKQSYLKEWRKTKGKDKTQGYYRDIRLTNTSLKKEALEYLGGKCKNCGYNKNVACLDFHHLDMSEKDDGIANLICRRIKKTLKDLKKELDKCIILCSNCHREIHFNDEMYNYLDQSCEQGCD